MRVVAGRAAAAARLAAPPKGSRDVRPTSDRARETLFSILGDVSDLARARPLLRHRRARDRGDLARRRLARCSSTATTALARRNVEELGIANRCELVRSDAIRYLERERGALRPRSSATRRIDSPTALSRSSRDTCRRASPGTAASSIESSARRPLELDLPTAPSTSAGSARR